jgi:hypothetical protein
MSNLIIDKVIFLLKGKIIAKEATFVVLEINALDQTADFNILKKIDKIKIIK